MEVARRLRNTNTLPENGSAFSFGAAQLGQRVDPLAEIDRLHRHQNPHLRRDGQHDLRRRKRANQLGQLAGGDGFQIQPQLSAAARFDFHHTTGCRSRARRQQFHEGGRGTPAQPMPARRLRRLCGSARLQSIRPLLKTRPVHTQHPRRSCDPIPPRQLRRRRPQLFSVAAIALHAPGETPQTAAAPAPHPRDSSLLLTPCPDRPQHKLSDEASRTTIANRSDDMIPAHLNSVQGSIVCNSVVCAEANIEPPLFHGGNPQKFSCGCVFAVRPGTN